MRGVLPIALATLVLASCAGIDPGPRARAEDESMSSESPEMQDLEPAGPTDAVLEDDVEE